MKSIFISWKRQFTLQLATAVVLIACFTVVGGVLTASFNLDKILTLWGESMQMSAYLDEGVTSNQMSAIENFFKNNNTIEKVEFISKEKATETMRRQMAGYAADILNDADLVKELPASFKIGLIKKIAPNDQLGAMQELASLLKALPGIEEVSFGQDWIKNYASITRVISWGGSFFIFIILLSAIFVIANSIRSSIEQRRAEIEVMELVGATAKDIRSPYIWEGAFLGAFTSTVAILICFAIFQIVKEYIINNLAFLQLATQVQFLSPDRIFVMMLFGTLMGMLSAWFCIRNINSGWAASRAK